jgi:hypothetical protein
VSWFEIIDPSALLYLFSALRNTLNDNV